MNAREQAKTLLRQYMALAVPGVAAGDRDVEMGNLIDLIIEAAAEEVWRQRGNRLHDERACGMRDAITQLENGQNTLLGQQRLALFRLEEVLGILRRDDTPQQP